MNVPSLSITDFSQEIKEAIDYWKSYKGKEIRIEWVEVSSEGTDEVPHRLSEDIKDM